MPTQTEISEHLGLVDWHEALDRLHLDDEFLLDKNVQTIAALQFYVLVNHRQRHLPRVADVVLTKLETQTFFICRFKETRTELAMNIDRETNHTIR